MSLKTSKPWYGSVLIISMVAGALSISACQKKQAADPMTENATNDEQSVPMSAEPADPTVTAVTPDDEAEDGALDDGEADSDATVADEPTDPAITTEQDVTATEN